MADTIASLGLCAPESRTNIRFIDVGDSAVAFEHFLSHGVIPKPWKQPGFASFVRTTVGFPAENNCFPDALRLLKEPLSKADVA